jgi:hypothetical protein
MRDNEYDAIVVGARGAGSPTAMLLARKTRLFALAALTGASLSSGALAAPGGEPTCFGESGFDVVGTRHADFIVGTPGPDRVLGGPFAMLVRGLPEDERDPLRARLREAFVPFAADGGYELPGVALCAIAS